MQEIHQYSALVARRVLHLTTTGGHPALVYYYTLFSTPAHTHHPFKLSAVQIDSDSSQRTQATNPSHAILLARTSLRVTKMSVALHLSPLFAQCIDE